MTDEVEDARIEYFLMRLSREMDRDPVAGLLLWAARISSYRDSNEPEFCERLLDEMRRYELPPYGQAIALYSEGQVRERFGHPGEAAAAFQRALNVIGPLEMPDVEAAILNSLAVAYCDLGRSDEALAAYGRILEVSESGNNSLRTKALLNLGGMYLREGHAEDAAVYYRQALSALEGSEDLGGIAGAYKGLGSCSQASGDIMAAQIHLAKAAALYLQAGDGHGAGLAMASVGFLLQNADQLEAAKVQYEQALPLIIGSGDQPAYVQTIGNMAVLAEQYGDIERALELNERAVQGAQMVGDIRGEGIAFTNRARLYLKGGDRKAAKQAISQAQAFILKHGLLGEANRLTRHLREYGHSDGPGHGDATS